MIQSQSEKGYGTRRLLLALMHNDGITVGDQLPSESTLASRLGVSRNTIRELLIQMETEGLLLRNHGIGTFLRRVPKTHGTYQSFPQLITDSGRKSTFQMFGPLNCVPPQVILDELSVSDKKNIKKIERVLLADSTPVAFVVDYLPVQIIELIDNWKGFSGDLVAMIGQAVGHTRFTQNVSVNALACDDRLARKLGLSVGDPVIHIHNVMQTMMLDPVAASDSYLRPGEIPLEYLGTIRVTPGE